MSNPFFSVIVPIFKVERYLPKCVGSILSQTYKDFELILVDDGSPDNCPLICDEYAKQDSRIKVVHKKNGGLVSARKAGAEIATGEYVVCVDGDDWIDEKCLEYFSNVIEKCDPDVIASSFIYAFENENKNYKRVLPYEKGYYSKEDIKNKIYPLLIQNKNAQYFPPTMWAKAYRSNLYKEQQLAVFDRIKIGEDCACTIPCIYRASSLYILDQSTYYYRQNIASMTKEKKAFSWIGPEMIHKHIQNQINLEQEDFKEQLYRKTAHELFLVVISQFYRKESYKIIIKDIKNYLQTEIYAKCIKKAKFKSLKGRLAVFAMKHRLYFLMKLYSKIKH